MHHSAVSVALQDFDPADVRKVALEEAPGHLAMDDSKVVAARKTLVEGAVGMKVPVSMLDALPYILTVLVLAGFVGKAIPPRAGGEPYVKER